MDKKFWQGVLSGVLGTLLVFMLVLGIGSVAFGGVTVVTGANTEALGENTSTVLSKMNSLRNYMNKYFMEEVDSDKLADGVYKGMFESLGDPYSCYYTKEEYDELMEESSGKYCGIGATITQDPETGKVYIVRPNDTIDAICNKYEININDLKEYNDITNINVGDKIIIPQTYD